MAKTIDRGIANTPEVKTRNNNLHDAKRNKNDEFYTRLEDIEKELRHYEPHLKGKTVYCNCDDPYISGFFEYFSLNFERLGLKKLITTCYQNEISPQAIKLVYEGGVESPTAERIGVTPLAGNGDFRSEECVELLKEADIVVTNPPFGLFREYIALLTHHGKAFIVLGNMNAATYKTLFPMLRDNTMWYGPSIRSGDRRFYIPDSYPLHAAAGGVDDEGRRYIHVKGVRWFTNLGAKACLEPLALTHHYTPNAYPHYDNYNAINVNRTALIPIDYTGLMGVPITFLDKYDPAQFEIVMLANGNARTNTPHGTLRAAGYRPHPEDKGGVGIVNGKRVYVRVLIRRKSAA